MVVLNHSGEEINAKVVYYGPGLSGKTTNIETIYEKMPVQSKGQLVSMKTRTDRTLFFDFLPLELGEIDGYRTRFLLYTVPGQVYYNATRKLVLKGVDAVVFVADSSRAKLTENLESLRNLEDNLNENGLSLDTIPWVIQYNKRDAADAVPVPELERQLNLLGVPAFEAVAVSGNGVYDTFKGIAGILFDELRRRLERGEVGAAAEGSGDGYTSVVDTALREAPQPAPSEDPSRAQAAGSPAGHRAPGQSPASARERRAPAPAPAPECSPVAVATPARSAAAPERDASLQFEPLPTPSEPDRDAEFTARMEEAARASDAARSEEPDDFIIGPTGRRAAPAPADTAPAGTALEDTRELPVDEPEPAAPAPSAPARRPAARQAPRPAPKPAAAPPRPAAAPPKPVAPSPRPQTPPAPRREAEVVVPVEIPRSRLSGGGSITLRIEVRLTDE